MTNNYNLTNFHIFITLKQYFCRKKFYFFSFNVTIYHFKYISYSKWGLGFDFNDVYETEQT